MAISAATVWELRAATGSDSNGGGFVTGASGTDFSQQAAAQYTFSDLAVDATTNTKVTSSGHSFVAADVGNLLHVTAGASWTQGFYQIVSVAAGAATLDRSPAVTSTTGGTYAVGGALATIAKAYAAAVSGNTFWLVGTFTVTAVLSLTITAATATACMLFNGYGSTRGDGTAATWTTATNTINLVESAGPASGYRFVSITFTSTAGTPGDGYHAKSGGTARDVFFDHCIFSGFSHGLNGDFAVDFDFVGGLFHCEIKSCTSDGIINSQSLYLYHCYIHNNTGSGVKFTSGDASSVLVAVGSVFYSNGVEGLFINNDQSLSSNALRTVFLSNCAFTNNTNSGVKIGSTGAQVYGIVSINCIYYSNGAYGINFTGTAQQATTKVVNNALGANTTAPFHNFTADIGTISLTGDPFNGRTTADYSLNNTAGAGAACRAAGFPGVSLFGTGYIDVGPLQHQDAGGGSTIYIPVRNVTQIVLAEGEL